LISNGRKFEECTNVEIFTFKTRNFENPLYSSEMAIIVALEPKLQYDGKFRVN
jgi:hypothetical protein